jgi:zinc transporter ZupT
MGLLPLFLLAGMIYVFAQHNPTAFLEGRFPPVEELTIERVSFPEPGEMRVHVVNGGPEPVTVAQVLVDEAYWEHEVMGGDERLDRLERATIRLPYPWVDGEPHEIMLLTSTGVTFTHEVEVATLTPATNLRFFGTFALLGIYAGLIPVLIGLVWYPFLRDLSQKWIHFFLSFTVGLLVFLGIDGLAETLEVAEQVAEAFQGVGLAALGVLGAILALRAFGKPARAAGAPGGDTAAERLRLAYLIAVGIGLHNLGEGLAIGASFAAGEIALGSFLVIGFALHNTTEGLGIVAPVAADRPSLWHLGAMGALAGLPTVAGAWIGGFSYSPIATTFFLGLGVGAIFEVAWEIGGMVKKDSELGALTPLNAAGLGLGLLVMYGTALFVVA